MKFKQILFLIVLILISNIYNLAQQVTDSHRCTVVVADISKVKSLDSDNEDFEDDSPEIKSQEIGKFDTVIGEEELIVKSFKLPDTKLFVTASVFYTDESMAGKDSQDSMSLEIMISSKPERNALSAINFAESEVLSKNFEVARASTIYKTGKKKFMIIMECRANTRPK